MSYRIAKCNNSLSSVILVAMVVCLLPGCVSKTKYAAPQKVAVQEAPLESDPAKKITNLSYDQLIARADTYLQNNNARLAALHYRKALDKNAESKAAMIGLSKVLVREGKFEQASQLLEAALEHDENNVPALLLLGVVARNSGNLNDSLKWLQKAYDLSPRNPEVLTELAITNDHIGQERLTYAEPLYKKVIDLKPQSSAAHNNLGFNYLLQGRNQEAVKVFSKALALTPDNQRAKNNLGAAYLLSGQTDEALKLFQNTVGLAAAYNNLGYIQMTRGNFQEAEKAFKKALQLNPSFYVRAQQNLDQLEHLNSSAR